MTKRGRPVGRMLKLTPELQTKLCSLIAQCAPHTQACAAVGIHYDSMRRWMHEGEEEAKRMIEADTEEPLPDKAVYYEFFLAITHAQAEAYRLATEAVRVTMIGKAVSIEQTVDELREKRLNAYGKEYEWVQTRTITKRIHAAPDGNLAIKFLERRDRENWTSKQGDVNVTINIEQQYDSAAEEFDRLIAQSATRTGTASMAQESRQKDEGESAL